jgi:hypothetical protein
MAVVTRVNGLQATVGTLYASNCNLFVVQVQNVSNSNIDLRAEDDAVDEAVEMIMEELNPLAYFTVNANTGLIYLVMDKNINDAAELQKRIRNMGSSVGVNGIDVRGTDVTLGTSFTVA